MEVIQFQENNFIENQRPKIGVAVFIIKDKKILMGKRKGSHGEGTWAPPGGHLEFGETIEECAQREVLEEAGINIKNIKKITYTNDIYEKENKHYVTCFVKCDYDSGDVKIMEPNKCEEWQWFEWSKLPEPLFLPILNFLKENMNPTI